MKTIVGTRIPWMIAPLLAILSLVTLGVDGQEARKALSKPQPEFPEIAKRMHLSGAVKVEVVIGANGQIKETKVIGGHPLLVNATLNALRSWKYAPGPSETTQTLEFTFQQ